MTSSDVLEAAKPWMRQCGSCDMGMRAGCICPEGDPRVVISRMAQEIEATRKALLDVTDVFGYHLTNDEVAEQMRDGWRGVPQHVAEDLSELRGELKDREQAGAKALRDFADLLRNMSARGVNQRITEALVSVSDLARREADGLAGGESA